MQIIAWVASAAILSTYFCMTRTGYMGWFNLANGLGGIPLIIIEVQQRAWSVLPVTAAFTLLGLWGCYVELRDEAP